MKYQFIVLLLITTISLFAQQTNTHVVHNTNFKYKVSVPDTWKIYGERKDTIKQAYLISYELPKIYSYIEKTEIENSVSVKVFKNSSIKSVSDLIRNEYLKQDPTKVTMEIDTESSQTNCRIIYYDNNGLKYKGKTYFVYKNEMSYVINFMATPGTYNKNLALFESFYNSFIFD